MDLTVREFFGLAGAIVVLAGVSMVVTRGGDVARILSAAGDSFSKVINAATLR